MLGLPEAPAPCPRCGTELTADRFGGGTPVDVADPAEDDVLLADAPASVRPPDLPPDAVRDADDPVAGWDVGVPVGVAAVRDERPFPLDTVVVVGAAGVGLALGLALGRRRGRDAVLGALGGAVGAGIARRVWQLP